MFLNSSGVYVRETSDLKPAYGESRDCFCGKKILCCLQRVLANKLPVPDTILKIKARSLPLRDV